MIRTCRQGIPRGRRTAVAFVAVCTAIGALAISVGVAGAAPLVGTYPTWSASGSSGAFTGAVVFDGVANLPSGSLTSDSTSVTVPTGASAFLNPGTPFGARFGSSQNQPYVNVRTSSGNAPSTTTITFPGPTPASGWAFALGDIDADQVAITATGSNGAPLASAALGFAGAFNYCATSSVPSSCSGPATDVPTWDPATGVLKGNVADTTGASGWFQPQASVGSITFVFTALSGAPIYQLWFATEVATISGSVVAPGPAGTPVPVPGAAVTVVDRDGTPSAGPDGGAVTTETGADGSFTIPGVVAGEYDVVVDPPPGFEPATVPVDLTDGDVSGLTISLAPSAPTAPTAPVAVPVAPRFTG